MSGTVFVTEEITWMPSAGSVDALLEKLSSQLEAVDNELSESLLDESKGYGWGFQDFRKLSSRQFNDLISATERVFTEVMRAAQYPANNIFILSLSYFKALLCIDERVEREVSGTGRLIIREGVEWTASACIFDMTLEFFAAGVYRLHPDLAESLLKMRVWNGTGVCDLRSMDANHFQGLLPFMALHYGATHGRSIAAPFFAELNPRLSELEKLFDSDPRALAV